MLFACKPMHFGPSEEDATAQIYMAEDFKAAADAILTRVVTSDPRVPGVVATATDR